MGLPAWDSGPGRRRDVIRSHSQGPSVADLDSPRYAIHEEAAGALADLGPRIEPELRAARDKARSAEVRARLDAMLARIPRSRHWDEIVRARAVAAMELAGTAAVRKVLAEWAAGAPGGRLTADAKAALARLNPAGP